MPFSDGDPPRDGQPPGEPCDQHAASGVDRTGSDAGTYVHATTIAMAGHAAMIMGPSGSGKSDLALRCLAMPACQLFDVARLVADDQTLITRGHAGTDAQHNISDAPAQVAPGVPVGVVARAPDTIAGLIEVRGIGLVRVPFVAEARVALMVRLVQSEPERLPDPPPTADLLSVTLPVVEVRPFEASAPHKVLLALSNHAFGGREVADD